jgi:peptide-N4-(N-acetyl-beta-glucosaminyl)asparagine amidase
MTSLTFTRIVWQRKLAYCIAFSVDGAADVTARYVRNFSKWGAERKRAPEPALIYILDEIRALRRKSVSKEEKLAQRRMDSAEHEELQGYIARALTDEFCKSPLTYVSVSTLTDPNSRKVFEARQTLTQTLSLRDLRPNEEPE